MATATLADHRDIRKRSSASRHFEDALRQKETDPVNLISNTVRFYEALDSLSREHPNLRHDFRENELRLISDLGMAREVQQQLLSRETPDIPGLDLAAACVPARELGGDFYDFLPYGSGRLALALGDGCGKGTAAALLGALTIGILRACTVEHAWPPAKVLGMLNDQICDGHFTARFVSMLLAVFDSSTRQLTFANAGNPYPSLLRRERIEEIPVSGIPLGLLEGTRYETVRLHVEPGDVLVFASDGILECQNGENEMLGTGGLATTLASLRPDASADEITTAILCSAAEFGRHASAVGDDRSLIVLRVTGESPDHLPGIPGDLLSRPSL